MSRRCSGDSRSNRKNLGRNEVKVDGYMRSNGTYVASYTRAAPRYTVEYSSESDSDSSDSEDDIVYVRGYTRANGTYVPGYSRAAPQRKACDNSPSYSSGRAQAQADRTKVSRSAHCKVTSQKTSCKKSSTVATASSGSYNKSPTIATASNGRKYKPVHTSGPKASGYAGIIPGADSIKNSTKSVQANKHAVPVSGYPRPATGKMTGSNSSKSNNSDVSSRDSDTGVKCYVDNAYNRKLGRVGKPLRTCIVRKDHSLAEPRSQIHRRLLEENKLEDLVQAMKEMQLHPHSEHPKVYTDYQYAIDQLQRDEVEENWRENCVEPSRINVTSLLHHYPEKQIPFADLELERVIGRGGFGEVYAGRLLGEPVAFKKLLSQQMSLMWKRNFSKEVTILATTYHPNIVKMLGYVNEDYNIGIVMEYLRCSLYRAVFIDSSLQDIDKKTIIGQVACALNYLHTHDAGKIAHCDIKSENVLLDWNDNVLLCDFGLSALKNSALSTLSSIPGIVPPGQGTPRYSAPEVLRGELLTMTQLLQADIYSLAIVVFEVMTEEEPFEGLTIKQLETNVGHGTMRPTSAKLSRSIAELLTRCWDRDARKRLTAAEFQEAWNTI